MNRVFAIGFKAGGQKAIYVGEIEAEAYKLAHLATDCHSVEIYINATPFNVVSPKGPKKLAEQVSNLKKRPARDKKKESDDLNN